MKQFQYTLAPQYW